MKIPAIKKLVEIYSIEELKKAEDAIVEGLTLPIDIEGEDEGEQLTHALAASWIKNEMQTRDLEFKDALREYTKRVRASIS
ncbi:MAG: hypothetical protein EAZ07_04820 [Cytophagales bacterium]|nr:MAG: hypothetical protein EAZ07_04820 [Cytophagales bacterium]